MSAGEIAAELAEIEDRIKTEIAAHLWKTEPLFAKRAKLLNHLTKGTSDD
jgi:hypothetical protein